MATDSDDAKTLMSGEGEVAPSTIAYLYCSQIVPAAEGQPGRGQAAFHGDDRARGLLGRDAKSHRCWADGGIVRTDALAVRLGMAAVLGLRDGGTISLETCEERLLLVKTRVVRAHLVGAPPNCGGIERTLLRQRTYDPKGEDMGKAFGAFVPPCKRPFAVVLGQAIRDAIDHGYLVKVPDVVAGDKLVGGDGEELGYGVEPVADRIAEAKQRFEDIQARIKSVHTHELPLWEALEKTIFLWIANRQSSTFFSVVGAVLTPSPTN